MVIIVFGFIEVVMMSDKDLIFGDAKQVKLKDEALNTKSWLSYIVTNKGAQWLPYSI